MTMFAPAVIVIVLAEVSSGDENDVLVDIAVVVNEIAVAVVPERVTAIHAVSDDSVSVAKRPSNVVAEAMKYEAFESAPPLLLTARNSARYIPKPQFQSHLRV